MRIGNYDFRPRIIPTLVTLVLLPVLISLGIWQLNRTEEKREILAKQEEKRTLPPLKVSGVHASRADLEYRRLEVSGHYLPHYHILVDNKVLKGQVGYYVVTPFQLENSDLAVLVNRGWVRAKETRDVLPEINTPEGKLTLRGTAKFNTKDIVTFNSQNRLGNDWPALVRWIDIEELDKDIPFNLKPFVLLQASEDGEDYIRSWTFINSPPEKNMSYAVQWFTLAAVLFLIFVIVNTKKIDKQDK